jgi:EAL domain-containing protein (putative c-di-GMP-specific phosphodiesterase class I)
MVFMKKRLRLLAILVLAALAGWGAWRYFHPPARQLVLTGIVDGRVVVVSSQIVGRIVRMSVHTGSRVTAGQPLAVLQQNELSASLRGAQSAAAAAYQQWRAGEAPAMRIGVNLFSEQFHRGDLEETVASMLQQHRLPPESLELEITENIILDGDDRILKLLQKLKSLGVCIAFDDFGTGYASLSLLKDYPLTRIKVDQSFVRNMCTSRRDEATVAAAINLARIYDLEVIAEGVETRDQFEKLLGLGCDEVQGYLFGKPMPVAALTEALHSRAVRPGPEGVLP